MELPEVNNIGPVEPANTDPLSICTRPLLPKLAEAPLCIEIVPLEPIKAVPLSMETDPLAPTDVLGPELRLIEPVLP